MLVSTQLFIGAYFFVRRALSGPPGRSGRSGRSGPSGGSGASGRSGTSGASGYVHKRQKKFIEELLSFVYASLPAAIGKLYGPSEQLGLSNLYVLH